jgi:hypothetical protein
LISMPTTFADCGEASLTSVWIGPNANLISGAQWALHCCLDGWK